MEKVKIIAVDDEIIILSILKMLLDSSDYELTTCTSGKEALELIKKEDYDMALLDIFMPEINGHELCRKVLAIKSDLIVIFLTGATGDEVLRKSFDVGGFDYIEKPVHKLELIARITNAMRVKRAELELKRALEMLEEKNQILNKLVTIDGLTQILNHKYIIEFLLKRFEEAKRYNQTLSIIMYDIDHFKEVNDKYGHLFGDRVLMKVANLLTSNLRKIDATGRYGGEEFLVVLPNTNKEGAVYVAESLRKCIEGMSFSEEPTMRVTFSGGVSSIEGKNDFVDMLSEADNKLYAAKNNGRNRIEY